VEGEWGLALPDSASRRVLLETRAELGALLGLAPGPDLGGRAAGGSECLPAYRRYDGNLSSRIGPVNFVIVGEIEQVETIASGRGVKVRAMLRRLYGQGRWRKRKGVATVRLPNGLLRRVELHWYEAHGIGRRDFKVKAYHD